MLVGFRADEAEPVRPTNPCAASKTMVERVLHDAAASGLRSLVLRYFNPLGIDPRLRTALRKARPTHVVELLLAAWSSGQPFMFAGVARPTRDGSAMRDYVHRWALAEADVAAVERFDAAAPAGNRVVNLRSGAGTTVRELVLAFRHAVGGTLEVAEGRRRPGDVVGAFAQIRRAQTVLGRAPQGLEDAIRHAVAWDALLRGDAGPIAPLLRLGPGSHAPKPA